MEQRVYQVYWEGLNDGILQKMKQLKKEIKEIDKSLSKIPSTADHTLLKKWYGNERNRLGELRFQKDLKIRLLNGRFQEPVCYYCGQWVWKDSVDSLRISMTSTLPTYTCIVVPVHPFCKDRREAGENDTYCQQFREDILPLIPRHKIEVQNLTRKKIIPSTQ